MLLAPFLAGILRAATQDKWTGVERVVAVGDVHGDCDALVAVLRMAGLVDDNASWIGGKAHLVQTGDIPARGPQTRKAMDLLMKLEQEADAAGGHVHAMIGNHDAMVMYGDLRTILPEEYLEFRVPESEATLQATYQKYVEEAKQHNQYPASAEEQEQLRVQWFERHPPGFAEHRKAFAADGKYGSWIRSHNAVININGVLYLHGGISPKMISETPTGMNEKIRTELADPSKLPPGFTTNIEGPLWYRGFAELEEKALIPHVKAVLKSYGVRRIVHGHSVTQSCIIPRMGSVVIDIDLGLSRFYGRPPACLIQEGELSWVLHNSKKIDLPGPAKADVLKYLDAVAAADPEPDRIKKAIEKFRMAGGLHLRHPAGSVDRCG